MYNSRGGCGRKLLPPRYDGLARMLMQTQNEWDTYNVHVHGCPALRAGVMIKGLTNSLQLRVVLWSHDLLTFLQVTLFT